MSICFLMESADDPVGNLGKGPHVSFRVSIPSEFLFPWLHLEVTSLVSEWLLSICVLMHMACNEGS